MQRTNRFSTFSVSLISFGLSTLGVSCSTSSGDDGVPFEGPIYSAEQPVPTTVVQLDSGERVSLMETGQGQTVVFLHGFPASSYLWRHVVPIVGEKAHVVAPDLPGYGGSDAPSSGDFSYTSMVEQLGRYLDSLGPEPLILVVNDLGSVLGLNYAVNNPERIRGIVFLEAVFMPPQDWMMQIRPEHRDFIASMRDSETARSVTLDNPVVVETSIQRATIGVLPEEVLANYRAPYLETSEGFETRRQVLFSTFGPENNAQFGAIATANAEGLSQMNVPMLLLQANPGLIVNAPALEFARTNFSDLTITEIPNAFHFAPEDNPEAIANAINVWLDTL